VYFPLIWPGGLCVFVNTKQRKKKRPKIIYARMRFARRGREGLTERFVGAALLNTYLCTRSHMEDWARANSHRVCRHGEKTREAEALSFPFCCAAADFDRNLHQTRGKDEGEQVNVAIIINFYMEPRRRPTAKLPTDL
jgi:hypothetical protein